MTDSLEGMVERLRANAGLTAQTATDRLARASWNVRPTPSEERRVEVARIIAPHAFAALEAARRTAETMGLAPWDAFIRCCYSDLGYQVSEALAKADLILKGEG